QQALGDADAVIVGDYNLPHLVAFNLAGELRASDARMLELLEPERPHRARAVALLMTAGRTPPRHGPRLPSASIVRGAL
ncbi:MAG: DNA-3-methyladenine glycosylase 2 family protein, partial [Acidimicrobiales bacterium]